MPDKPASEKTEQPTPRRLQKAREEGQVAQSQELPSTLSIAALVIALAIGAPALCNWFMVLMKEGFSCDTVCLVDTTTFRNFFDEKIAQSLTILCPILGALAAGSVFASLIVSGANFAPKALMPKFDAINPAKGFEKLFDFRSVVKLLLSIAKIIVVSLIAWFYIKGRLAELSTLHWVTSSQYVGLVGGILLGLLIRITLSLLVIATIDVIYQKFKHLDQLKMTKQEVKREMKDTDGSPEVKIRIRRIALEMTRKRMMQEIPKATMVIVNPTHVAVALKYDPKTMNSPVVVAKGTEHVAAKIREIARAYGVPIVRRPQLARTLYSTVKIGNPIPSNIYVAVAEILAMIYRLKQKKRVIG